MIGYRAFTAAEETGRLFPIAHKLARTRRWAPALRIPSAGTTLAQTPQTDRAGAHTLVHAGTQHGLGRWGTPAHTTLAHTMRGDTHITAPAHTYRAGIHSAGTQWHTSRWNKQTALAHNTLTHAHADARTR
jgi:hypothetical protein